MFEPVAPSVSFPELDNRWLKFWDEHKIFEKSVESRRDGKPFVFYEGPPTANGMPHPGHVLTRVMKDVFLRYRAMTGHHVPRHAGWDTHGLPVEVEVEKQLGIHGRAEIEKYGVEAFSHKCVASIFKYIEEWRRMTRRIAFWIDLDAAYVTFHREFVESVWWALAELYKKKLLYQDYKVVWWWPQGGTALSSGEVGQGYKAIDDPSVMVRFRVTGEPKTSFLAWTTTPWTLPSNIALAVHPKEMYATAELETGERVILAQALVEKVLAKHPHKVVATALGAELAGRTYEPPFRYAEPEGGPAFRVIAADFVTMDTGSGMVHIAPAFGEDDFRACKENKLGFLQLVQPDGKFPPAVTDFAGRFCKEADRDIIRNLRQRELLFHEEVYRHDYPFCWRAMEDPLIQYARRSWFIRTTREIQHTIANNQAVHWEPEHIRDGRFGEFLRNNVDWALSRERFWGTPLPIWINDATGSMEAIASVADLLGRNPQAFAAFDAAKARDPSMSEHLRVHKPWIDQVTFTRPGEAGVYRRVPEVIDCWFDSGCMPFAQWGYPHARKAEFEKNFPADFITEAVDQTRGWFYSLITISTLLFGEQKTPHPYRNCVVLGLITDEKGQKMSKSKGNYTDPLEMIDQHGADAVRWALYTGCVPGQNTRFFAGAPVDALREFLLKVWNVYSFFVTYANIDDWKPGKTVPIAERNDLDRWLLAELDACVRDVSEALEAYRSHVAARRLEDFVDALSNWYVRRSRARFWASVESADKNAAFATLFEALTELSRLLAPFTPLLAEALHQNLARGADGGAPESVHLADFPVPVATRVDDALRADTAAGRTVVTLGQRVRAEQKIKVRQPLASAIVVVTNEAERKSIERLSQAIKEELNVHELEFTNEPAKYVEFTLVPNFRALGPKLGKDMPACKQALAKADGSALYAEMQARGQISVNVGDRTVDLGPTEVEVRLSAKPNFAAAAEGRRVVVLDTRITDELRLEGLAREFVNRVQRARKDMDLAYEARIRLEVRADAEVTQALEAHEKYICAETLAETLTPATASPTGKQYDEDLDGHALSFWVASGTGS